MAASEYAAMEPSELADKLAESRKELFNLRFQRATGQLDNTARIGHVRKDVARILTVLRQQELGIEEPVSVPVARVDDAAVDDAAVEEAAVVGSAVDEDEEEA